jgi:hypothetical protein
LSAVIPASFQKVFPVQAIERAAAKTVESRGIIREDTFLAADETAGSVVHQIFMLFAATYGSSIISGP